MSNDTTRLWRNFVKEDSTLVTTWLEFIFFAWLSSSCTSCLFCCRWCVCFKCCCCCCCCVPLFSRLCFVVTLIVHLLCECVNLAWRTTWRKQGLVCYSRPIQNDIYNCSTVFKTGDTKIRVLVFDPIIVVLFFHKNNFSLADFHSSQSNNSYICTL